MKELKIEKVDIFESKVTGVVSVFDESTKPKLCIAVYLKLHSRMQQLR